MSQQRAHLDYVRDMQENAEKAMSFVASMNFEQFSKDEKTVYAVVRAIEIIGEAVKKIPKDVQQTYTEIPWREIAGTRDILIHDYTGVNLLVVWRTVQEDLPTLVKQLQKVLDDYRYSS